MKKVIVVLFVLLMVSVGMSSAVFWDIQKLFTGRQMIPYGAPWIADDTAIYFGEDKDVSIKYNSTSGQGEVVGLAAIDVGVNASTNISTTLTSFSTKTVYDMDASSANVTLTLPDAATVPGRMYFISTSVNPGSNYVRITATGGDDINGNNYLVSTDQWSNAWIVASNGAYRAVTSGTWAAHA
jgi:hypothetical protein